MTTEVPGTRGARLRHGLRRSGQGWNAARRGFRRWRRSRPFWGGLLLVAAGVQLFLSTQLDLLHLEISFGPEGYLAIVLPAVLVLCGVLLWVTPQHRYFYSVIGTVTAVYSLLGLNLGGWFLGMLFGIVGGALGFAWTPVAPGSGQTAGPAGSAGPAPAKEAPPGTGESDSPTEELPPSESGPRAYLAAALPLVLVAGLGAAAPLAATDSNSDDRLVCRALPLLCGDGDDDPSPSPTPGPTPGTPPTPGPSPTAGPDAPGDPDGSPSPSPTGSPTPTPTLPVPEPAPEGLIVAAEPGLMTASRLDLEGFLFEGVDELQTPDGPIDVMKFSFDRSTSTRFTLETGGSGDTTLITADPLVLAGDVDFYTSRFHGWLFGIIPLQLTPDSPIVDLMELIALPLPVFFTRVEQELVFTHGDELTAAKFALHTSG